mgnify:CR=1 FL=1
MDHSSRQIVGVAALAVVDVELRRGEGVLECSSQQVDRPVPLGHEHVTELVVVGGPDDHPYDPEGPATVLSDGAR